MSLHGAWYWAWLSSPSPLSPAQCPRAGPGGLPLCLVPCPLPCPKAVATHGTASLDLGPLQGDGDAVEKDESQDDIVEELVGDDGLTQDPEPG